MPWTTQDTINFQITWDAVQRDRIRAFTRCPTCEMRWRTAHDSVGEIERSLFGRVFCPACCTASEPATRFGGRLYAFPNRRAPIPARGLAL